MTEKHLLKIYTTFIDLNNLIDEYNTSKYCMKKIRRRNFPDGVSEYLAYLILSNTVQCKGGDLKTLCGKKIEIKCFSSDGPISFGPTEKWSFLILIDARKHPEVTVYLFDNSNDSVSWSNIKVNRKQTFRDQCKQGKRPRITFNSLQNQISLKLIGVYDIFEMLKKSSSVKKYSLMEQKQYRIADFFAGVGGLRLGFESVSKKFKCVFSNEIDQFAVKTYEENFPSHPVTTKSITDLKYEEIPSFDIFLGGFPCQPFSIAGHRKGFDDERGNLFMEIARILRDKKPQVICLENVKNLETHDNGNTMKIIVETLLSIGYTIRYQVLNSSKYANVPQNRERIFIVGFLDKELGQKFRFPTEVKLLQKPREMIIENVPEKYYYTDDSKIFPILEEGITQDISTNQIYQFRRQYVRENKSGVCPTLTANMGGGGHNVPIIKDEKGIRKLCPRECFNFQGFPCDFTLPNISNTQLYKQAGNSVTVPLIARIAEKILQTLEGKNVNGNEGILVGCSSEKKYDEKQLKNMNCLELKEICRKLRIPKRSKMRKGEMINAILDS